jgi:hypothetical protein
VRVLWGHTTGAGDDFQSACDNDGYNRSADVALAWKAPIAGTYTFDTKGSSFLTVLSVLDGCSTTELTCSAAFDGEAEVIVELAAEKVVVIIVDGDDELSSGYFSINVGRYALGF